MKEDTESLWDQRKKRQPFLLFWNMLSNTEMLMFSEGKKNKILSQSKTSFKKCLLISKSLFL